MLLSSDNAKDVAMSTSPFMKAKKRMKRMVKPPHVCGRQGCKGAMEFKRDMPHMGKSGFVGQCASCGKQKHFTGASKQMTHESEELDGD